jgi:hypothetical protein
MKTISAIFGLIVLGAILWPGPPAVAANNGDGPGPSTNHPPTVQISSPSNGASFLAPANIFIAAQAQDLDGYLSLQTVEFFAGTNSLGIRTNLPTMDPIGPFRLTWTNVPAGTHTLTAVATDDQGATGVSAPVQVRVYPALPVVTIQATDPRASEPGILAVVDAGIFNVTRTGDTNSALRVWYRISGTASNGIDCTAISNSVTIPAGAQSGRVVVNALHDLLPEGTETVVLTLVEPVVVAILPPPAGSYRVGTPNAAVVEILDNDGPNPWDVVTIVARDAVASEGTNCHLWPGWADAAVASYGGTNTALFVVRRDGPTNAALTVHYQAGGTASNGLDYAVLPGHVTVPAGQRSAPIVIWPKDDALPECVETVVLALRLPPTATNTLSPYSIGWPRRAGAIIVDNDRRPPPSSRLPDRCFHLTAPGVNGSWFRVECSTDLVHWSVLGTNLVTDGAIHFVDPEADELPGRFYRALPAQAPAGD